MIFGKLARCLVYPCSSYFTKEPTRIQLLDQLEITDNQRKAKKLHYEKQLADIQKQVKNPQTPPTKVKELRKKQQIYLKKLAVLDKQDEVSMGIQTRVIEASNASETVGLLQLDSQITSTLISDAQATRKLIPGIDKMEENKAKLAELQTEMDDLISAASLPLGDVGYSAVSLEEYDADELDRLTNERLGSGSTTSIVTSTEPLTRPSVYTIPSAIPPTSPIRIKSS